MPEQFWSVDLRYKNGEDVAKFNWARVRVFDRLVGLIFYEKC